MNENAHLFDDPAITVLPLLCPEGLELLSKGPAFVSTMVKLGHQLVSMQPDLVIVTMNARFVWPFTELLRRQNLRLLYVAHDAEPHPGDYARMWQRLTQGRLVRSADLIVSLSSFVSERIAAQKQGAHIASIPLEAVLPQRPAVLRRADGQAPMRFLFFGRLVKYKGLSLLAEAISGLAGRNDWQLTIAGTGPLRETTDRIFKNIAHTTLDLHWVSRERMVRLMQEHDALLCPYIEASQSGVIAEALSWGLPSLVTPVGGLPEQVGHGKAGLVASSVSPEGFRALLLSLIENRTLLEHLSAGALRVTADRQRGSLWPTLVSAAAERRP